jgi:hypothetical protein
LKRGTSEEFKTHENQFKRFPSKARKEDRSEQMADSGEATLQIRKEVSETVEGACYGIEFAAKPALCVK